MTLIVEDGTGLANAESYASVAEADTYHLAYTGSAEWAALAEPDKERHLRLATQAIDATYVYRWSGTRGSGTQALAWPRFNAFRADGEFYIDSNVIPVELKRATAEAALRSSTQSLMPDVDPGDAGLKSEAVKVGPVEEAKEWFAGKSAFVRFTAVERLLEPLLVQPGTIVRA